MNAKEYIIKELELFLTKFTNVRIRYEYDIPAITHVIEIIPNNVYHSDEEYISWELDMYDNFSNNFPTENIYFISDDALVGIENPIFVKEGLSYAPFSSLSQQDDISSYESPKIISLNMNITYKSDNKEQKPIEAVNINMKNFIIQYSQAA